MKSMSMGLPQDIQGQDSETSQSEKMSQVALENASKARVELCLQRVSTSVFIDCNLLVSNLSNNTFDNKEILSAGFQRL